MKISAKKYYAISLILYLLYSILGFKLIAAVVFDAGSGYNTSLLSRIAYMSALGSIPIGFISLIFVCPPLMYNEKNQPLIYWASLWMVPALIVLMRIVF